MCNCVPFRVYKSQGHENTLKIIGWWRPAHLGQPTGVRPHRLEMGRRGQGAQQRMAAGPVLSFRGSGAGVVWNGGGREEGTKRHEAFQTESNTQYGQGWMINHLNLRGSWRSINGQVGVGPTLKEGGEVCLNNGQCDQHSAAKFYSQKLTQNAISGTLWARLPTISAREEKIDLLGGHKYPLGVSPDPLGRWGSNPPAVKGGAPPT